MATLNAHGLAADPPAGWDAAIYRRRPVDLVRQGLSPEGAAQHATEHPPILQLCTRPLPVVRGDLGGGVVADLGPDDVFLVLVEQPGAAGTALFAGDGVPWPLRPSDFDAATLRTPLPGQLGCQRFFTANGRAFMLYVVLGGARSVPASVAMVNRALAGVAIG
jgi:hypothetical protein